MEISNEHLYNDFKVVNDGLNFDLINIIEDDKEKYLIINNKKYLFFDKFIESQYALHIYNFWGVFSSNNGEYRFISPFSPKDFNNINHDEIRKKLSEAKYSNYSSGVTSGRFYTDKELNNEYNYILTDRLIYNVEGAYKGCLMTKKDYELINNKIYKHIVNSKLIKIISDEDIKCKYPNILNYFK